MDQVESGKWLTCWKCCSACSSYRFFVHESSEVRKDISIDGKMGDIQGRKRTGVVAMER